MKNCQNCGSEPADAAALCANCGASLHPGPPSHYLTGSKFGDYLVGLSLVLLLTVALGAYSLAGIKSNRGPSQYMAEVSSGVTMFALYGIFWGAAVRSTFTFRRYRGLHAMIGGVNTAVIVLIMVFFGAMAICMQNSH